MTNVTRHRLMESLNGVNPSMDALATLGDDALPWIEEKLVGGNLSLITRAIFLAGRIGKDDILREALKNPTAAIRCSALEALSLGGWITTDQLKTALNDAHPSVRLQAVRLLSQTIGAASVLILREFILGEENEVVASAASQVIERLEG